MKTLKMPAVPEPLQARCPRSVCAALSLGFVLCLGVAGAYAKPASARKGKPAQESSNSQTKRAAAARTHTASHAVSHATAHTASHSSAAGTATKSLSGRHSAHKSTRQARERMPVAPTSARISEIQSALATQGAYQGDTNGRWDASTMDAMRQFQSAHGLNPTGKLDALTLQKLGLGSDVAGRGAPTRLSTPQASILDPQANAPSATPEHP